MILDLILTISPFLVFFFVKVLFPKKEKLLSIILLTLVTASLFYFQSFGLFVLFLIGLVTGIFIEVILGFVVRTQFWENASLFGVPYWLPLIWGYGFVIIYKIGLIVFSYFQ